MLSLTLDMLCVGIFSNHRDITCEIIEYANSLAILMYSSINSLFSPKLTVKYFTSLRILII